MKQFKQFIFEYNRRRSIGYCPHLCMYGSLHCNISACVTSSGLAGYDELVAVESSIDVGNTPIFYDCLWWPLFFNSDRHTAYEYSVRTVLPHGMFILPWSKNSQNLPIFTLFTCFQKYLPSPQLLCWPFKLMTYTNFNIIKIQSNFTPVIK